MRCRRPTHVLVPMLVSSVPFGALIALATGSLGTAAALAACLLGTVCGIAGFALDAQRSADCRRWEAAARPVARAGPSPLSPRSDP